MIEIILVIFCYLVGSYVLQTISENLSSEEVQEVLNQNVDVLKGSQHDILEGENYQYDVFNPENSEIVITFNRLTHYRMLRSQGLNFEECENYFNSEQGKMDQEAVDTYIKFLQAFSKEDNCK